MKKITLKIITLLLLLLIARPYTSQAQPPFCPMGIWNDAQRIGLVNQDVYNTFSPGSYYVTVVSDQNNICFINQMLISITKTDHMNSAFPNAASNGAGIVFNFPPTPCTNIFNNPDPLPDNSTSTALQTGSTSILVTTDPLLDPFLVVNYTDNQPDDCIYIVIPVTFGPFTANLTNTSPLRTQLNWTTYTEQNINHFTIQKSLDAITFYKIGQVTAVGNSNSIQNYTFFDNYPTSNAYYRIVSIDNDCKWQYTIIVRVTCQGCSVTDGNPAQPADCSVPPVLPVISGPGSICNNARTIYRLNNLKGDAKVTWSISPYYLAGLTQASRMVGVTPTGSTGVGTLTATVVKNGVTSTYSLDINFGIPQIYSSGTFTPAACGGGGTFTATVSILPGTHPYEYHWYSGGMQVGSGQNHTWNLLAGQNVYYEVRYNSPCGQSVAYGSSGGGIELSKTALAPAYTVSPNPARSSISISKPICPAPRQPLKSATGDQSIIIKIYDMQGNLRKTAKMNAVATKIEISTEGLQPGLYYAQISEPGKEDAKLKVWIEK